MCVYLMCVNTACNTSKCWIQFYSTLRGFYEHVVSAGTDCSLNRVSPSIVTTGRSAHITLPPCLKLILGETLAWLCTSSYVLRECSVLLVRLYVMSS